MPWLGVGGVPELRARAFAEPYRPSRANGTGPRRQLGQWRVDVTDISYM